MRGRIGIVAIALVALAGTAVRGSAQLHATLRGEVKSNGERVSFANVIVLGTRIGTMTDSAGQFVLERVPPGRQRLLVQALGHVPRETTLVVVAGENPPLVATVESKTQIACQPCFWVNPYQGLRSGPKVMRGRDWVGFPFGGEDWTASARSRGGGLQISSDPNPCQLRIDASSNRRRRGRVVVIVNETGQTIRTWDATERLGVHVAWDGLDAQGVALPEGTYRVMLLGGRDTVGLQFERVRRPPPR